MYINFWYVADQSQNITESPVKKKMLGQNFVLFRDTTGKVHCLSDVCVHRGGSLSGGKLLRIVFNVPTMVGNLMGKVNVKKFHHWVRVRKFPLESK